MDPNGAECLQMQILGLCTKFRDSWGPVFIFTFLPNWVPRRNEMWTSLPLSVIFNSKTSFFVNRSFALSRFFIVFVTLETKRLATSANQMSVCPLLMWKKTHVSTNFMNRHRKTLILSASQKVSRLLWKLNLHYSSLETTIGIYPEPTEPS